MGCDAKTNGGYRFAGFEIACDTLRLRSGERVIALPPLSRRFLLALLQAAPGILSYEKMTSQVWGKRYVSLQTITQRVKLLRQALGDNGTQPEFIELVRGEGYRLIPAVNKFDGSHPLQTRQTIKASNFRSHKTWLASACALAGVLFLVVVSGAVFQKTRPVISETAHELYNHGMIFLHRRTPGDIDRAETHFLNSIRAAPEFVEPWVALAGVYGIKHGNANQSDHKALARLQHSLLLHALTLAPDSAMVHARLGLYYECIEKDLAKAQKHIEKAYLLDPADDSVLNIYGHYLIKKGKVDRGIKLIEKAISVRPDSRLLRNNLSIFYMWLGQLTRAEEQLNVLTELIGAEETEFASNYARLRLLQKRPDEAIMYFPAIDSKEDKLALSAIAFSQQGKLKAANRQIQRLAKVDTLYAAVRYAETLAYFERYSEVKQTLTQIRNKVVSENSLTENQIFMIVEQIAYSPFLNTPNSSWDEEMTQLLSA